MCLILIVINGIPWPICITKLIIFYINIIYSHNDLKFTVTGLQMYVHYGRNYVLPYGLFIIMYHLININDSQTSSFTYVF